MFCIKEPTNVNIFHYGQSLWLDYWKGFAIPKEEQEKTVKFSFMGQPAEVKHGGVVIANITSGNTKTSPSDMVEVGLVAKKAYDIGLKVSFSFCYWVFTWLGL